MKNPKKHLFFSMYANLPLGIRKEIVVIIDREPMTFNVVKLELENNTEIGYKALEKMIKMGIINEK
jgi:hypothetical protein